MATKEERISEALAGATKYDDPVAIWREKFAAEQVTFEQVRIVAGAIASVPEEIVTSLLETQGESLEERFRQAQPNFVSAEEVRAAWLEHISSPRGPVSQPDLEPLSTEEDAE